MIEIFNYFLIAMSVIALIVFISLYKVEAGYGMLISKKWGMTVNNRLGWILMEAPIFISMTILWLMSDRTFQTTCLVFFLIFQTHYFQRSFVFPFLLKGKSKMPLSIIAMGVVFNSLNALMQGGWIFFISPENRYTLAWLLTPQFIIGVIVFFTGMIINIQSDKIIRNLRKSGDSQHYIPQGGMFKYVSSANYFGELLEWTGWAIMTWSWAGLVFVWWTFANLAPRASALNQKYASTFGKEFTQLKRKRIIPFIY